jgi:hypothetical protein
MHKLFISALLARMISKITNNLLKNIYLFLNFEVGYSSLYLIRIRKIDMTFLFNYLYTFL